LTLKVDHWWNRVQSNGLTSRLSNNDNQPTN